MQYFKITETVLLHVVVNIFYNANYIQQYD